MQKSYFDLIDHSINDLKVPRKILLIPIAMLVILILLLIPIVPITTTFAYSCPTNNLCLRVPPHATELPNDQYSFVMYESIIYWLFNLGGFINGGWGFYGVTFPNTSTFGGLVFYVLPLCTVDIALFIFAFMDARKKFV